MKQVESGNPVIMHVETIFFHRGNDVIQCGDIFLTPKNFYYIPYANFNVPEKYIADVKAQGQGIARRIANSILESDRYKEAVNVSRRKRDFDWGMSINEREERYNDIVIFEKKDIKDFDTRESIVFRVGGKIYEFGIDESSKNRSELDNWFYGDIKEDLASCVISCEFIAPRVLIEKLIKEDVSGIPIEDLKKATLHDEYIDYVWNNFSSKSLEEKRKIIKSLEKVPKIFQNKIKEKRTKAQNDGKTSMVTGVFSLALCLYMVFHLVTVFQEGRTMETLNLVDILCFILVVPSFVYGLYSIWIWSETIRY
jgi:hypothetical protein